MHKQIVVSGDPHLIEDMLGALTPVKGIVQISIARGSSVKPPGDVLTVYATNRVADEVMRQTAQGVRRGQLTVVVAAPTAFVDRGQHGLVSNDDDEALWEEMETQLRNHGRLSANFVLLMALGGVIGAVGLTAEPVSQAIALVAASIVAPGFEPLAKMSQGLVLKRTAFLKRGLVSVLAGYASLMTTATLATLMLRTMGTTSRGQLASQPIVEALTSVSGQSVLPSICAATAGVLMIASLRDTYVVGPLMTLVIISGTALAGAACANGDFALAAQALGRVAMDMVLVFGLGAGVFFWKQKSKHRRPLLP